MIRLREILPGRAEAGSGISCLRAFAIAASLLATTWSSLSTFPHQLGYFNEFAGGPESGHKHLLGSNLDWGQDMWLIREWMRDNRVRPVDVQVVASCRYPWTGLVTGDADGETRAWNLVSVNEVFGSDDHWRGRLSSPSVQRVGHAMWAVPSK